MEQNQMCSICEQQPEQLLILSCQHNLCVNCATEVFVINEKSNPFCCEICLSETELDEDTIAHLTQLTERKIVKKPPKSNRAPKPQQVKPKEIEANDLCNIHKQKPLYFCFNCQTGSICSECILTPKHSNHKVVTIKKALSMISKQISERIKQKQQLRDELTAQKTKYSSVFREIEEESNQKKAHLKEIFDEIIRSVTEYYAELTSEIEQEVQKVEQMLQGCLEEIQSKINMVTEGINYDVQLTENTSESQLLKLYEKSQFENFQMYFPRLPQEIPTLDLNIRNFQSANESIEKIIHRIVVHKNDRAFQQNHQNSFECSIIHPEPLVDHANDQEQMGVQTALKESRKQRMLYNNSYNSSYKGGIQQSGGNIRNSRKLEMSRSIDNATNIINKLKQRSRIG